MCHAGRGGKGKFILIWILGIIVVLKCALGLWDRILCATKIQIVKIKNHFKSLNHREIEITNTRTRLVWYGKIRV